MKAVVCILIVVIAFGVMAIAQVSPAKPAQPTVIPQVSEVFVVNDAPTQWTVCVDELKVYGAPGENEDWYLYTLYRNDVVWVRELGQTDSSWAMINPAEWVVFQNLC